MTRKMRITYEGRRVWYVWRPIDIAEGVQLWELLSGHRSPASAMWAAIKAERT